MLLVPVPVTVLVPAKGAMLLLAVVVAAVVVLVPETALHRAVALLSGGAPLPSHDLP
jgi:hypothetical protein